jgi:pimeloyl-ACP methyl ester carboxylesterase
VVIGTWELPIVKLDTTIHKGYPSKPVVIFIHGLGMDKNFWIDPLDTKVFARNIPMKVLAAAKPKPFTPLTSPLGKGRINRGVTVGNIPKKINTVWTVVKDRGFNVICWSQRRPVGPISVAVEELHEVVMHAKRLCPKKPIALLGHSRGGLIARKFMEKNTPEIKALITLSTPHQGSSLSRLEKYISPLSPVLKRMLPKYTHGTVSEVMWRTHELLQGNALRELLPGSDFFRNLNDAQSKNVRYLSFGGNKTRLLTVYRWKKQVNRMYPKSLVIVPDSLIKILPASVVPPELISGKGDFMVTAESSVLPWAEEHYTLQANHISITWNKKVISRIIELLQGI